MMPHQNESETEYNFRAIFSRITADTPSKNEHKEVLKAARLDTLLGPMLAIADEQALCLLEFIDCVGLEKEVERLCKNMKSTIIPGDTKPITSIENELKQYFEGKLKEFKTPFILLGSFFQKQVWQALQKIPLGETRSYSDIAGTLLKPSACRAVAQANGANQLAILIPCHRVIQANGDIGGYAGGVARKKWLLDHEQNFLG